MPSKADRNALAVLGFARAIADQYRDQCTVDETTDTLLQQLESMTGLAFRCWPRVNEKTLKSIAQRIVDFNELWPDKSRNIQTYLSFSLRQLEALLDALRNRERRQAIAYVVLAESVLYKHFTEKDGEYQACMWSGDRAAELWEEVGG